MALRKGGCRDGVVALAGIPNVGKSTLFNRLTGETALVANWPGATVTVEYSVLRLDGRRPCIVDLPGTYSINGTGPEEAVARDFILSEKPNVIIALADSTNIEKTLILPLEIMEIFDNVVLVLTKYDEAMRKGIRINVEKLSKILGVPVVAVSSIKGIGIEELKKIVLDILEGRVKPKPRIGVVVPQQLREAHKKLTAKIAEYGVPERVAAWLAARLLEGSDWAPEMLRRLLNEKAAEDIVSLARELVKESGVESPQLLFITEKFNVVSRIHEEVVEKPAEGTVVESIPITRLDTIFLHPVLGPLTSFLMLLSIFLLSYMIAIGSPTDIILEKLGLHRLAAIVSEYNLVSLTASLMDWIASTVESRIGNPVLAKLIGEGVLSSSYGVGLVISFMPLVAVFMALVAVLEDSGLMPRIAAGMDKMFSVLGVSGKAVFPALLSFGCNVPAVFAARIMDSEHERRAVIFALPLLPCTARYTVIMAFAYAYFHGAAAALAAFTVYLIAITAFMLTVKLYTWMHGVESSEFLLELPPLKRPNLKVVWWLTWDKLKHFIVRAGTVILVASIVLWLLSNYGPNGYIGDGPAEESYAAMLGRLLTPYVELISGVSEDLAWRIGFGIIGGFIAKEVFLDSLAAVAPASPVGDGDPAAALAAYPLSPAQALALLVAVTLYIPCLATLASIRAETGSWRFALKAALYDLALATVAATTVRYVAGMFLG